MISSLAGFAPATRASSAAVAADGTTHRDALASAVLVQARKKRALMEWWSTASVKKVASCRVTTDAAGLASAVV
jgi:hypothetical protein